MFCPKCGSQQPAYVRACVKCNSPLSTTGKLEGFSQAPQNNAQNNIPNNAQNNAQVINDPKLNFPPFLAQKTNYPTPENNSLPPWIDSVERPKFVYPDNQSQPINNNNYQPGQYLQPQDYKAERYSVSPSADFYTSNSASDNASKRAVWALVFSVLSFAFCPIVGALIGFTLSYQELEAIEKGLSSPNGKTVAQAGYYLSIVNLCLYGIGALLLFLLVNV